MKQIDASAALYSTNHFSTKMLKRVRPWLQEDRKAQKIKWKIIGEQNFDTDKKSEREQTKRGE